MHFFSLTFSPFLAPLNGKLPPLPRGSDTNGSVSTLVDNLFILAVLLFIQSGHDGRKSLVCHDST